MARSNNNAKFIEVVIRGRRRGNTPLAALSVQLSDWRAEDFSLADFDRSVDRLVAMAGELPCGVRLHGAPHAGDTGTTANEADEASLAADLAAAACQIATRCQRLGERRNGASRGETFDRLRAAHRDLHDLAQAPEAAAYAHALDTWQWLLRLEPQAGFGVQLAALFHDVEPAVAHRRGACATSAGSSSLAAVHSCWIADEILADHDVDLGSRVHVHQLIVGLDQLAQDENRIAGESAESEETARWRAGERLEHPRGPQGDLALLAGAEALSSLALESAGWSDREPAQVQREVASALARIDRSCHHLLAALRLPAAVAGQVAAGLAQAALSPADDGIGAPMGRVARGVRPEARPAAGAWRGTSAVAMVRSRMSVGLLGAAGFARTRTSALLRRAEAVGALAAPTGTDSRAAVVRTVAADTATSRLAVKA